MAQVLKITRPDRTTHVIPYNTDNLNFFRAQNNRLPDDKKFKIETVEESEVENLPFIDEAHVTGSAAVQKLAVLQQDNAAKDAEIERLRKQLAEKTGASDDAPEKADVVIGKIEAAETVEAVEELIAGETRKTVLAAAEKRKKALQDA